MDAENPPIARSDDGRSFLVGDATGTTLVAGSLVVVSGSGERQLALVEERSETQPPRLRGRLIGVLAEGRLDTARSHPFEAGTVEEVDAATIEVLHATTGALLEVGTNLTMPGGPAKLLPRRFNRHTFWCGQSGSGKTYALGVVLEQIVAHTALPVVIFDPNSDFVRLGELNPGAAGPTAEALAQRDIRVLRGRGEDDTALRARFIDMKLPSKAAVLRLDPVADREEYNSLVRLQDVVAAGELNQLMPMLHALQGDGDQHPLAERIENLGVLEWEVWAGSDRAVTDVVAERPDATVLDLGGFSTPEQQLVVALSLLDDLWERREERRPVLLVIDEAHNLCSPRLDSPLAVALQRVQHRQQLVELAGGHHVLQVHERVVLLAVGDGIEAQHRRLRRQLHVDEAGSERGLALATAAEHPDVALRERLDRGSARATRHPRAPPSPRGRRRPEGAIPRHEPAVEGGGAATRPHRRSRRVQHADPPAGDRAHR